MISIISGIIIIVVVMIAAGGGLGGATAGAASSRGWGACRCTQCADAQGREREREREKKAGTQSVVKETEERQVGNSRRAGRQKEGRNTECVAA